MRVTRLNTGSSLPALPTPPKLHSVIQEPGTELRRAWPQKGLIPDDPTTETRRPRSCRLNAYDRGACRGPLATNGSNGLLPG